MPEIVFEDNHLLVVVKPPNLPTQADASGDPDLHSILKEDIRVRYNKPGNVYLGLVHRLDRPVGGLMVFAKTSKAASRLSEQLRVHDMGREYLCIVTGAVSGLPDRFTLHDFLLAEENAPRVRVVPKGTAGAKEAVLHAEKLASDGDTALLAIRLESGRKHQIRVQLANAGLPLWGDNRYGPGKPGQQIALWGYRLHLTHPTTKEAQLFQSLPVGGKWAAYADAISALKI